MSNRVEIAWSVRVSLREQKTHNTFVDFPLSLMPFRVFLFSRLSEYLYLTVGFTDTFIVRGLTFVFLIVEKINKGCYPAAKLIN